MKKYLSFPPNRPGFDSRRTHLVNETKLKRQELEPKIFNYHLRLLFSVRCKHNISWQHLSQKKGRLLKPVEFFFPIKMQQARSGKSAASYKLMQPRCCLALVTKTRCLKIGAETAH